MSNRSVRVVPVLLLTGCLTENVLHGRADDRCLPGDVTTAGDPCFRLHGDVTVLAASTDPDGAVTELPWSMATGDVYPFGPIFVGAFRASGDATPDYLADDAVLDPDLGANAWSLRFPAPEGSPVYVQALLDRDDDGILQVAEPSALWHEPLVVEGDQLVDAHGAPVDEVHLFVSVPWHPAEGGDSDADGDGISNAEDRDVDGDGAPNREDTDIDGDGAPNGDDDDIDGDGAPNGDDPDMDGDGDGNGEDPDRDGDGLPNGTDDEPDGRPLPRVLTLTGDARADGGLDCNAMLFSVNGYGPYNLAPFQSDRDWALYVAEDQGDMLLAGSCDTNANGLVDPADDWGGQVEDGELRSLISIGDRDLRDLRLRIPYAGGPTPAPPVITVSGTVLDLDGTASGADSVMYVVAQRGTNVPDPTALDHEYAWSVFAGSELTGAATPFSLVVPGWQPVYVWAWVDRDGDGVINEPGEAAGASGPWYTDVSHDDLEIQLTPAGG